jgi:glutamate-ammonia-ligase adenylyltransferase
MWSCDHPALSRWTDNIRIIESLRDEGIFDRLVASALTDSYKALRESLHRLNLQQLPGRAPCSQFERERALVSRLWQENFDSR